MVHCGMLECRCCSRACASCGRMKLEHELEDGVCEECRLNKEVVLLRRKIDIMKEVAASWIKRFLDKKNAAHPGPVSG
jgi:hypothetical protein